MAFFFSTLRGVELAIRISKKDRRKLRTIYGTSNKARKKYNRLRNKGVSESQLPIVPTTADKLVDYAKLTNMSRKEFNSVVDELLEFSKPYNPDYIYTINKHDVAISKTQQRIAQEETKRVQQEKGEHYQELMETEVTKPTSNAIVTPEVLTEFGADLPIKPVPDFDIDSITSEYGLESYIENMQNKTPDYFDRADELYKENFRQTMFSVFNSSADAIVSLLDDMDLDTFMKLYVREFLDMNIDYIYDEAETQGKAEEVFDKIATEFANITGAKEVPTYSYQNDTTTINSETGEIVD